MVDAPKNLKRLEAGLKAEMAKPETMRKFLDAVSPRLAKGKRNLVYVLAQVERIGHLAMEVFFLKTLYGSSYDRIVVLTGPTDQLGVNKAVFDAPGGEFAFIETDDSFLPLLGFFDGGLLDLRVLHLALVSPQRLVRDFGRAVVSGSKPFRHFRLSYVLRKRGDAWMRSIGADPEEPFVLLHVRDASYLPEKDHHLFRCADISRYHAAIDRLVGAGYRVFRLGDSSSPRLSHPSDRVVDVPHEPTYQSYLDVYLSARCAFAVNQASGPEALVRAFGRPALTVNLVPEHLRLPLAGDVLVFKQFRRASDGKTLSYGELLDLGAANFGTSEEFEEAGILVEENTAEALDAAVAEMLHRVDGNHVTNEPIQQRFLELGRAYEARITKDPKITELATDFYAYAHPFGVLSESYVALNPGFIGEYPAG